VGLQAAMEAVERGDVACVRALVQADPRLLELVNHGDHPRTLLHAAAAGPHPEAVSALLALGAAVDRMTWSIVAEAFQYACANARSAVAQHFLDRGVDINGTWHIGTPLHWAAYCGHLDMVQFLVAGADVTARDDEWQGNPASWAAQRGRRAVIEFLRQHGG
jgi:ankyrin repeat protein